MATAAAPWMPLSGFSHGSMLDTVNTTTVPYWTMDPTKEKTIVCIKQIHLTDNFYLEYPGTFVHN